MITTIQKDWDFKELSLESSRVYNRYCLRSKSELSNSCFASRWSWNPCFMYHYTIVADCLCLVSTIEKINEQHLVMPLGHVNLDNLQCVLDSFNKYFSKIGKPLTVMYVEERHLNLFHTLTGWDITYIPEPDYADYVYLLSDLSQLNGHKYRSPRRHVSRFTREHQDCVYHSMKQEDVDECLYLAENWCSHKGLQKGNIEESDYIPLERVLRNFSQLDLTGGVIKNSDGIQAFIIGSKCFNAVTIHFQKASHHMPDLYAAMQYEFCRSITDNSIRFVNREDDMGLENIRIAKTSYHPLRKISKYTLILKRKR